MAGLKKIARYTVTVRAAANVGSLPRAPLTVAVDDVTRRSIVFVIDRSTPPVFHLFLPLNPVNVPSVG